MFFFSNIKLKKKRFALLRSTVYLGKSGNSIPLRWKRYFVMQFYEQVLERVEPLASEVGLRLLLFLPSPRLPLQENTFRQSISGYRCLAQSYCSVVCSLTPGQVDRQVDKQADIQTDSQTDRENTRKKAEEQELG